MYKVFHFLLKKLNYFTNTVPEEFTGGTLVRMQSARERHHGVAGSGYSRVNTGSRQ
ncbi:hypothetical protein [Niabella drilacis]|uniref:Uncharacterized protein n=1 Tax=Niabella drilacis (strain DSM 25811 / CCM 8410 / CCUG 62505 / LMG 26954 / E90) TaxID=1285928 RepID=A0A1G6X3B7_NIADE|nr:hypothetical protein [Niabella drilacis]SDD72621.1 hypothetical protein SAMN04487894_112120 [Niabella drilacis]